ncbi:glycoside hydrolase family 65 protein [Nocardioides bizhenqiangii]|uniref:Glycosyl hydrolase family 65 protein n=1 Tax=Nocardioides bizhenqiangii TaxID=3095076 RepID=A0ABZ0ZQJ2_9ACTN|nr:MULTISPECIES: glycosyl hydrolase family 65 protein [unclassified Nocardioides]MDZ5619468.1 glycosyl hydrolase family 65 protein [Nocardioides sp. HM23]WQQ26512.1 glycosyl hydrolase family 65 protein [Nocardioides sp. HM61]
MSAHHRSDGPSHVAPPVADPLDRSRFPTDAWRLVETRFEGDDVGTTESLFAVGNGYLGMRGNYSESRDAHVDGTYINGFHETWPILHAEEAYGFARIGQTIVNAPDAKVIRLYVDDEPLHMSMADLLEYERALDFRSGQLTRELIWRTPGGKEVRVRSTRMVPLAQRHLAVLTFEVTLLDQKASVAISSQLINRQDVAAEMILATETGAPDPRKADRFERRVLEPVLHSADEETGRLSLGYRAAESGMTIGVVADHELQTASPCSMRVQAEEDMAKVIYQIAAEPGVPIKLTKLVSYHTAASVPPRELIDRCERTLSRTHEQGVEHQFAEQRQWLDDFWARCDVEIPGHPKLQQAVRWNLFALCQAAARAEGQGIAAKGVTGSGYGGHYFWDTEIYVMPFLTYTMPWAARNALRFRYSLLKSARSRAHELSQRGALFPWRTINGHEASAYYAAGTAQYHIDADIAYALSKYVGATGDDDFLTRGAIDIFVETARLWADLGFWRDENRRTFHIHGVTGPDEYTTVVNDNLYTNVLARFNLRRAAKAVWRLERDDPDAFAELVRRTGLDRDEPIEWSECSDAMFIPYDEFLGIHPQDAHFLEREMWDLEHTPLEKRPLLLYYHPLVIYRFQVLKQADVVLALFLQGEEFSAEQKRADFDYYDPITTGDSTLSAVVQSIIAAEVGYADLALRYFLAALFVDLDDRHNNTSDGVHVASTGGVWSALVSGFGGFRDCGADNGDEQWQIDPRLPSSWEALVYRITLHGTRVRVTVRTDELELYVEDGAGPLTFDVRGEQVVVKEGPAVVVPLEHQGPMLVGEPPNPAGIQRADGTVISAIVPSGDGA